MPLLPQPVHRGEFRDSNGWKVEDLNKWMVAGGLKWVMLNGGSPTTKAQKRDGDYMMDDVSVEYEKANKVISDAQSMYNKTVSEFRSAVKNDLASIGASANKVQNEAVKIQVAYQNTAKTLTTPDMEKAIANAERLAAALGAISSLSSHNITFAVLDRKLNTDAPKEQQ